MASSALTRRAFLAVTGGAFAARAASRGRAATGPTRLVLLGTAGGPTPKLRRAAPAQALVVGDRVYLVDCGDGVAPVDAYGPPPLERMTRLFLEANDFDIQTRMADEERPPLAPLVRPHEIGLARTKARPQRSGGGAAREIFRDDRVRVTCALNHHPPIEQSFAYRFETADRSIVISGDTSYAESVRELARGADVLVHEALYAPYWQRPGAPQPPAVVRHILASHTDAADAGRLAAEAGVKTLVLTHFVPSDPPDAVTDEQWLEAASRHFKGQVILGKDLMEL
ncbi:MAG: metallo-beta-lactamase superfamily protein [Acidobacteria bacterium]|nr:metallo-beta-lactamase superfamily protein [Acidobacteriota bacterium]